MPKLMPQVRERLRENMRAELREELLRMLQTIPLEQITVAQLAKNRNIAKGSVYNYYSNKEELLHDVLASIHRQNGKLIDDIKAQDWAPMEKIVAYADAFFLTLQKYKNIYYRIYTSGDFVEERRSNTERLIEETAHEITKGIQIGLFRADLNPAEIAVLLIGSSVGMNRLMFFSDIPYSAEECRQIFRKNVTALLAK